MSLRKNVPFAPVTAPAAGMSSSGTPARIVVSCAEAVAAPISIPKNNTLRRMRVFLMSTLLFGTLSLHGAEIVIRAARVLDGRGNEMRNAAVVIDGSKIVRIEPHTTHIDIDLGDRTLMPGAIDTHVHIGWHFDKNGRSNDDGSGETPEEYAGFAMEDGAATLMGGVTTVQSLGAPIDKVVREFAERNNMPLPRVLTAVDPIYNNKLTPDEMRAAVDKAKDDGADMIKIFASQSIRNGGGPTMSQEQMDAACGEANRLGLRTAVHAHGPESVRRSVMAGCTTIEHGALIDQ